MFDIDIQANVPSSSSRSASAASAAQAAAASSDANLKPALIPAVKVANAASAAVVANSASAAVDAASASAAEVEPGHPSRMLHLFSYPSCDISLMCHFQWFSLHSADPNCTNCDSAAIKLASWVCRACDSALLCNSCDEVIHSVRPYVHHSRLPLDQAEVESKSAICTNPSSCFNTDCESVTFFF
jgi:hypothetical protein